MSTSRTSSTPSTSLRPRAARLISGLSDTEDDATLQPVISASPPRTQSFSQPTSSRTSPLRQRQARPDPARRTGSAASKSAVSLASLWGSTWNNIQGIANDFLGEQAPEQLNGTRQRRNSKGDANRLFVKPKAEAWGPKKNIPATPASYIATGSSAEREALVRAQKRKALLSGAAATYTDASGNFKRRTSEDGASASAPPGSNEDRDALIYLHHVKPQDTLAGITIKYSCQANVLRKANRMWPNDAVQVRKVLVLPVDACGVKGRPISEHQADLMMDPSRDESDQPTPRANGSSHRRNESASSNISEPPVNTSIHTSASETDPPWVHDSWVMFPNATAPTEIARLPRRSLGYFPPARRKSLTYSDLDTPSTSLDISRTSSTYFDSAAPTSAAQSPLRQDAPQRPRRPRRTSNATNGYFPSYLAGPGGVGTMNKNVKTPGPAQDGLNRLFASKLPNVAPPPNQQNLYMPDVPLYTDDPSGPTTPRGSGMATPTSQGMNLENVGAAVEGWIRKMAVRAQKGLDSTAPPSPRPGGASGVGDLIEMADQWDLGSDDDRGRAQGAGSSLSVAAGDATRRRDKSGGKGRKGD